MAASEVLFFAARAGDAMAIAPDAGRYHARLWRPSIREVVPPGLPRLPYAVWWIMHFLRVFRSSGYCVLLVDDTGELVHRCLVTPAWFRFPFMAREDLQIGDVWTRQDRRRQGLAAFGISQILRLEPSKERRYWYLTAAENTASVRTAQRSGFLLAGRGRRTSTWGIRALGRYLLDPPGNTSLRGGILDAKHSRS